MSLSWHDPESNKEAEPPNVIKPDGFCVPSDKHHARDNPSIEDENIVDNSFTPAFNDYPDTEIPESPSQANLNSTPLSPTSDHQPKKRTNVEFKPLVRFTPWRDVNIESLGYDPRSSYVEKFWLPFLGPSTILTARRLIELFEVQPYGFPVSLSDLSLMLGLGQNFGRNSSIQKTLNRMLIFEVARVMPSEAVSVRLKLPPLPQRYIVRLPQDLQDQHAATIDTGPDSSLNAIRTRARSLALALSKLGHDRLSIENQLISWRFHPSVCYETLNWIDTTSPMDKPIEDS